ncbi:MAG TPA: phage portal protein [Oligoflexus sp.]|uniref:phage portal protein n=1 Tax=Oligoflexus sp. TaxID=1971216 RepID=UPI002D80CAF9|nr:phage portal protein [Oligoflexus sp.]HET9235905.1 phage portal protein [Oligoflexus sp.]
MRSLVNAAQTRARNKAAKAQASELFPIFRGPDAPYRSTSRENTATSAWFPASASTDDALLGSMRTLRDQSRDLDRNEGLARGAIENYVTNVVSDGLRPQSRIDHRLLGVTEKRAREFEQMAEIIFEMHMGSDTADFHETASFPLMQAQVLRAAFLDGDSLAVRRFSKRPGAILSTSVQLIDGARLRNPDRNVNPNMDVREGVEFRDGAPVAFHVAKPGANLFLGTETVRVPRFDSEGQPLALHIFQQRLIGQSRGEPLLAPIIEKFKQISRYSEAEIAAAVINAYYSMFITTETGGTFGNRSQAHLSRDDEGAAVPVGRRSNTIEATKGTIVELLPNEKVMTAAPGRPNSNYDPFVQAVIKQIGIGLGLPYEVLTQHFQSSYSAARGAILEAWKAFKARRAWLVSSFCQPVWEWVITDAVRAGLLEAPGFFESPLKRKLWLRTQWCGSEMESIDPLKDAKAHEVDVKNGFDSRRSILESRGRDFDKLMRELEEEKPFFSTSPEKAAQLKPN